MATIYIYIYIYQIPQMHLEKILVSIQAYIKPGPMLPVNKDDLAIYETGYLVDKRGAFQFSIKLLAFLAERKLRLSTHKMRTT